MKITRFFLPLFSCLIWVGTGVCAGFVGLAYGPFREGQNPATLTFPSPDEVSEDMGILKNVVSHIRTYSSFDNLQYIVEKAAAEQIQVAVGISLTTDATIETEIQNALTAAIKHPDTIKYIIVGNEFLFENYSDAGRDRLIGHIIHVRRIFSSAGISHIPITTCEGYNIWMEDASRENRGNPFDISSVAKVVDVIMVNIHPFFGGSLISTAADDFLNNVRSVQLKYPTQKIVVGETGWPTQGRRNLGAEPSVKNQETYWNEIKSRAIQNDLEVYFFDAFDENWKPDGMYQVEKHWGIYTIDRRDKTDKSGHTPFNSGGSRRLPEKK